VSKNFSIEENSYDIDGQKFSDKSLLNLYLNSKQNKQIESFEVACDEMNEIKTFIGDVVVALNIIKQ
jgi:hypothetical protein